MTVDVRPVYTREFWLRMWLGMQLLKMAAWVLGCNFVFEHGDREEPDPQLSAYRRTRQEILRQRAKMGYQDAIEALRVEYGETL